MGTGEGGKVNFKKVWRYPSILPNAFIAHTGTTLPLHSVDG